MHPYGQGSEGVVSRLHVEVVVIKVCVCMLDTDHYPVLPPPPPGESHIQVNLWDLHVTLTLMQVGRRVMY